MDPAELQRLAGHLVPPERSPAWSQVEEIVRQVSTLTEMELILLIDGAWAELRRRAGLPSDAPPRPDG